MSARRCSVGLLLLITALSATGGGAAAQHSGSESSQVGGIVTPAAMVPATITDCSGQQVTFDRPPARIVALDGFADEFLIRLGLGELIVGTGDPLSPANRPADIADQLAAIPVLGPSDLRQSLGIEQIAAATPDIIVTTNPYMLDSTFSQGSPAELLGSNVQALAACHGTSTADRTGLEATYQFIEQLGQVFGVPDQSMAMLDAMHARQAEITARIPPGPAPRVMVLGGLPTAGKPSFTWGGNSLPNGVVTLAGGDNVFGDVDQRFFTASAEEVAARDPEFLVVVLRLPFPSGEQVAATLRADPVLGLTTAARDGRFVVVSDAELGGPSYRNLDGLERIVEAMYGPPPVATPS